MGALKSSSVRANLKNNTQMSFRDSDENYREMNKIEFDYNPQFAKKQLMAGMLNKTQRSFVINSNHHSKSTNVFDKFDTKKNKL